MEDPTIYNLTRGAASAAADIIDQTYNVREPSSRGEEVGMHGVELAADCIMWYSAELIASLLDAGSEREAVMESQELRSAIEEELGGWFRTEAD